MKRFKIKLILSCCLAQLVLISHVAAQKKERGMDELWGEGTVLNVNYKNKEHAWYKNAKFAMFIHWGLYSDVAGEWNGKHYFGINEWIMKRAKINTTDYKRLADTFNPTEFNADEITQLAVDAGMRYIVITMKHHDGFAMYHSKASKFNIVDATPYKKDPIKELAKSCKEKGLKLGFYYSQTQDWTEKDGYGNNWEYKWEEADFQKYLNEKALPQIEEILTNYGEVGCIFFDTPGPISADQVKQLKAMVEKHQPNCLINSRIGKGLGDFVTLGDNEIPNKPKGGLWETPDTHNNTWAYSKLDINWKSPKMIVHRLINVISKGGNYMFNIGPKGDGSVPELSADILREAGNWIHSNEEAIYGTDPVYIGGQSGLSMTSKPGKLFLFVKEWPVDGKIWLPDYKGKIENTYFLDNKEDVRLKRYNGLTCIDVPLAPHDLKASVIVLEHKTAISFHTNKILNSGTQTILYPYEAKIDGVEMETIKWMEIFGDWHTVSTLSNWQQQGSSAEWSIEVPKPGMYEIEIKYSCPEISDLQEGILSIDNNDYSFVPVFSGEIGNVQGQREKRKVHTFKTRRIGVVKITSSGKHKIALRLNDIDKNGWINLSEILIKPIF